MKLLLDTHIWLWSLLEPARLGPLVGALLEDPDNETWLSPVTVWETLLLAERKRIALHPDAPAWVRDQLSRLPFVQAPLNFEVALESRRVRVPHDDPADRFLAATAAVYGLTLVTADRRLHRVRGIPVLRNR